MLKFAWSKNVFKFLIEKGRLLNEILKNQKYTESQIELNQASCSFNGNDFVVIHWTRARIWQRNSQSSLWTNLSAIVNTLWFLKTRWTCARQSPIIKNINSLPKCKFYQESSHSRANKIRYIIQRHCVYDIGLPHFVCSLQSSHDQRIVINRSNENVFCDQSKNSASHLWRICKRWRYRRYRWRRIQWPHYSFKLDKLLKWIDADHYPHYFVSFDFSF